MGTIGKRHQAELDLIANKAVEAWEWSVGQEVNPSVLDEEDLAEAYAEVFKAIRYDLDGLAKRVGTVGHSESYLRGSLFPKIWVTLSDRGVFYDFDFDPNLGEFSGEIRPSKPKDLRHRLLRRSTDAGRMHHDWTRNNRSHRTEQRKAKHANQVRWNQPVVDCFNELAVRAIEEPSGTFKEQMGERMVGLQWFLGRRPWMELGVSADFRVVEGPEWADGWLMFSGHAKKTLAEKEGTVPEKRWAIPIFGIDPDRLLDGFNDFRELQELEPWFQPSHPEANKMVNDALFYSTEKVLRNGFAAEAFKPVLEAGYEYRLTMHRFRDLYVSRGHWYQSQWDQVNGQVSPNIQSWAATYLGHFGDGSEQDTGEYLKLEFLGQNPLPVVR